VDAIVKTCDHHIFNGKACAAPAIDGQNYCRHHLRFYDANDLPSNSDYSLVTPDNADAALLIVHQATRALLAGKIDLKTHRALIYAAQVESNILQRKLAHDRATQEAKARNEAATLRAMCSSLRG
jgi:hypothetical protein